MKKQIVVLLAACLWFGAELWAVQKREKRDIGSEFSGIELATHGTLKVKTGDRVELFVEADEEILQRITTRIEGDTLVIDRKSRSSSWLHQLFGFNRESRMHFFLTVRPEQIDRLLASSHGDIEIPELTGKHIRVELSSHGEVTIDDIKGTKVDIELSSHGDLEVGRLEADSLFCTMTSHGLVRIRQGQVQSQNVELSSHGDYLAENLVCEDAVVELSSHGTVKVHASRRLEASITSHGDLYYRGNPELDIADSQRKKIRRMD